MRLSNTGFGCYRVDNRIDEHVRALKKALLSGITVIDTSSNYTDGRSEILVGNVIDELLEQENIKREDITIVTKVGYMQGQNYKFALRKKEHGSPFEDVVEYGEGLWHCISPGFLDDQLNRQMFRLDQNGRDGYIDAYLLHNPEYFLLWAQAQGMMPGDARREYYSRIKKAFVFLEAKAKEGKIVSYGISSNTFPAESGQYDFTSLEKIIKIAKEVSEQNHFIFIQMPFNLVESGALLTKNQANGTKTVLETAKENGLRVLVNRPLNAITKKGLIRLADFKAETFSEEEFLRHIKILKMMEDDFVNDKLPNTGFPDKEKETLASLFTLGSKIGDNSRNFGSIEHLNDVIENYFSPRINYLMDFFENKVNDENLKKLFDKYLKVVFGTLNILSDYYKATAVKRSAFLHSLIDGATGGKTEGLPLSKKAILLVSSVDGVDCVLSGARKEKYSEELAEIEKLEKIENAGSVFIKIKESLDK